MPQPLSELTYENVVNIVANKVITGHGSAVDVFIQYIEYTEDLLLRLTVSLYRVVIIFDSLTMYH